MTREEALELLKSCDTWECIPNKVINKTFDDHEAETTQLKERIAELEAELEQSKDSNLILQGSYTKWEGIAYSMQDKVKELEAEVLRQRKWGMQRRDDAHRFNSENKKLQAELQELKSGVVAELIMDGMTINDLCSSAEVDDYSHYAVTFTKIREKKQ